MDALTAEAKEAAKTDSRAAEKIEEKIKNLTSGVVDYADTLKDKDARTALMKDLSGELDIQRERMKIFLGSLEGTRKFGDVVRLAGKYGLDVADVFNLKVESVLQPEREALIADALVYADSMKDSEAGKALMDAAAGTFELQPNESRSRIYLMVLCGQLTGNTDNKTLKKVLSALAAKEVALGNAVKPDVLKKIPMLASFVEANSEIIRNNADLASLSAEELASLRILAKNRPFSSKAAALAAARASGIAEEAARAEADMMSAYPGEFAAMEELRPRVRAALDEANSRMQLAPPAPNVPHFIFEPLLELGAGEREFEAMAPS